MGHLSRQDADFNAYSADVPGRFVSADSWTVGGPGTGGYDRYAYAGSNPVTFTDPSGHSFVEYAFQMARGPLAAAGEMTATGVLFSAVFGAAAGGVAYAVFGPEPKTAEGALTWMLIGGIDGVCGAVAKNAFFCGALNGALFQAADDWLVKHQLSSWWDYAKAASLNGLLGVGAGWAGYGPSKVTKPALTWLERTFLRNAASTGGSALADASAAAFKAANGPSGWIPSAKYLPGAGGGGRSPPVVPTRLPWFKRLCVPLEPLSGRTRSLDGSSSKPI